MVATTDTVPQPFDLLITEIANELIGGRDPKEITDALEQIGWSEQRILDLLEAVDARITAGEGLEDPEVRGLRYPRGSRPGAGRRAGSGDGGFGLLIWIGCLVGFNVLSFLLDWGWIVY